MCDVYKEECFSKKKNLHKSVKHGFSNTKRQSMELEYIDSPAVSKEGHADCCCGHENTHNFWFSSKKV